MGFYLIRLYHYFNYLHKEFKTSDKYTNLRDTNGVLYDSWVIRSFAQAEEMSLRLRYLDALKSWLFMDLRINISKSNVQLYNPTRSKVGDHNNLNS